MQEADRVRSSSFGCITVPFLLIALVPLLWGARASWQDGQLLRNGEVAEGRVLELRHVPSNPTVGMERTSTSSPVVSYTTQRGEPRTVIGSVNRGPAPWKVGDVVDVTYDPSNPDRADLNSELDHWLWWLVIWCVVAAVPAAFALLPVLLLVRQRRAQRMSRA
jgi:hypothetical protein